MKKAEEKSALTTLRAPADGVVQQLAVHTVGAVVKPADTVRAVIPKDAELIVDARVLNRDAGFVHEGQPVEDRKLGLIYMARARLLQNYIEIDGKKSPLAPGLSATAEIKTGDRSIISYLLSPLARRAAEVGRER